MSNNLDAWARLADADHLRRALVDLSAFVVAYAALADFLVSSTHGFLDMSGSGTEYSDRDLRLARCDPNHTTPELIDDAVGFFVDGNAFTVADATQIRELGARRVQAVDRAHALLAEDTTGEFLAATFELRDLLRRASRWWLIEIEAAIQPEMLEGQNPDEVHSIGGTELLLDYVLHVAQATAAPDQ